MTGSDRFIVFTGGPGSGKSTLLDALAAQGVAVVPEAGRAIIRDQVAIGGPGLPWADRAAFAELMLAWEMRSWREAERCAGPVLFDRGVPDVIGYLELCGLAVPAHAVRAAELCRYSVRVFIAPPWPEIYAQDGERKQSLDEAARTYDAMVSVYGRLGYELVALPCVSVEERVSFVRASLGSGGFHAEISA